ncbi:Cell wall hydrolase/autolysin OS=Tsukamurella paurometabola (strain ATCC 8368 / DSM / CCUG 35730/ CIP 100753 / JCM 10117 / KCTC 9821 / NBRC 16120 / NCIMB 702349 / NCTC 13040) OX=521096 GN=Tpau_2975 PE=4 SV=1 [Tsukamurella paurometabola]|uniref:Cell wall hydrolase/autolysin n=1 Tax=Tsukamurella paurometabola (strain ATCC 8368 / DSM 20162 / CCUG 35730 / CIP 100753 / JCM 10117 / KCTC 9821 / NBRC 16120 / NCIMB 702349 / NCTC 13040) TaxID=521096 RepID=D5UU68_TSUPD|nr:N-acetylmuramoyl-L-alanine amidase [Tsukamurella paurometabola]ADG79571.1 cell wall hydrolase/autolysin [Tsukamurella paurometabola DSM 20162]SUP36285.1 N-acetylmuramoyl-L-alanine amidase CwlD [Tsukamurella paurometabola]
MKKTSVLAGPLAVAAVALFATPGLAAADPAPAPAPAKPLDGKTVFLDAGSSVSSAIDQARKVADGRGGSVPCVNPVAIAANGTPDHKINFAVTKMVEAALQSQGAKVILSRADDAGFGGCIDERATKANASGADLAVSINNVVQDAAQRGFLLETPAAGAKDAKVGDAQAVSAPASTVVRDAQRVGGFVPAQYLGGKDGLAQTVSALPSLVTIPLVYANLGNLANPEDAALLTSPDGQVQYAATIANGVISQLTGKPVAGKAVAEPVQAPVQTDPGAIPQPPVGTAPAAQAPAATAPAAQAPAAPAQTPIVPAVPGGGTATTPVSPVTPGQPGTSPIVSGVPMLQGGAPAGTQQAPTATVPGVPQVAAQQPAPSVSIPGVGQLTLPQLPQITIPGQSQPLGINTLFEMGPKAVEFLSSPQGSQLVSTLMSSPQALASLQSAQGPAAAADILKSILGAGALLPR